MKWQDRRRSAHVEDRRGRSARGKLALGGGGLLVVLAIVVIGTLMGKDMSGLIGAVSPGGQPAAGPSVPYQPTPEEAVLADFVSVVLADTEDTWTPLFAGLGRQYEPPTLVLFSDSVDSACGFQTAATGPFYCPGDRKAYIDLAFYRDLDQRFGAPGDFAQAYVLAHEVGHHVQNLLGTSAQVRAQERGLSEEAQNALSVRVELQADCFAGVWAHHADRERQLLEPGDVEEGLAAAAAIGDDRLQREARGRVTPESFTHGTSEQRVRWFRAGMQIGRIDACDTFGTTTL
jgi:predicted metalloprotease